MQPKDRVLQVKNHATHFLNMSCQTRFELKLRSPRVLTLPESPNASTKLNVFVCKCYSIENHPRYKYCKWRVGGGMIAVKTTIPPRHKTCIIGILYCDTQPRPEFHMEKHPALPSTSNCTCRNLRLSFKAGYRVRLAFPSD